MGQQELVTAARLEEMGILSQHTARKMARAGKLPCYGVGLHGRGVRFIPDEVLQALRRKTNVEGGQR